MLRRDGESTRKRILEAALEIFGEKGYHDATNAAVCEAAGANIAAINYHFRSKELLYRAVCEYAIASMEALYPPGGGVAAEETPEKRLRGFIEAIIKRAHVKAPLHYYHRIRMTETFSPTGLVDDLWRGWFGRHGEITRDIVSKLLGSGATDEEIRRCNMSVMSQCYIANSNLTSGHKRQEDMSYLQDGEAIVNHIYSFSMAGIRAVALQIQQRSQIACSE